MNPRKRGYSYHIRDVVQKRKQKRTLPKEIEEEINHAIVYFIESQYDESLKCIEQILDVAAHLPTPYNILGMILETRGEFRRALAAFTVAALLSSSDKALSM